MNPHQWLLLLECGHEVWVTRKKRPQIIKSRCYECVS